MRKLSLLVVLMICTYCYSQEYNFGLKGGINYNSIGDFHSLGGSIATGTPDVDYTADSEIGTQFGFFLEVKYNRLFIRPEVMLVSLKNSYDFPTKSAEWTSKSIDIPILLGYKVYGPIGIYAGPVFSFISETTFDGWEDTSYAGPFTYNESSTSVSAGILIDFGFVGVDFRYQYGLTKVEEQRLDMVKTYNGYGVNLGDLLEYNPSQIILSLNFNILKSDGVKRSRKSSSHWRNHANL